MCLCILSAEEIGAFPNHKSQLLRFMVENGARVDAEVENGQTALHVLCAINACDKEYEVFGEEELSHFDSNVLECVNILLKHGVNVNGKGRSGCVPLHLVCGGDWRFPKPQLARILLDHGADINAALDDGRTTLHILCDAYYRYDFEYDDADYYFLKETLTCFNKSVIECVRILLEHGANVDVSDNEGNTPLVLAAASGKSEVVAMLIKYSKENN